MKKAKNTRLVVNVFGYEFNKVEAGVYRCHDFGVEIRRLNSLWFQRSSGRLINQSSSLKKCAVKSIITSRFMKGKDPDMLASLYKLTYSEVLDLIRGAMK